MNDKEFRRLRRGELVEIIYQLEKELNEVQQEKEQLRQQLEAKTAEMQNAVSISQAVEMLELFCNQIVGNKGKSEALFQKK